MIRLVAMDVDGTLTDGGLCMNGDGGDFKCFNSKDGAGITALKASGVEIAFISGRFSKATEQRAGELGVKRVINGTADKLADLTAMAEELGIEASEVAFIGDDLQDLPCIKWAGLGIAVADSSPAVLSASDWVCPRRGGAGAVRDAMEHIAMLNGTPI